MRSGAVLALTIGEYRGNLELSFETRELRTLCEDEAEALAQLSPMAAEALKHRLADIRAASTIYDLLVGDARPYSGSADGAIHVLDLADGWMLRFSANHCKSPRSTNETVDWTRVSRIKIVAIEFSPTPTSACQNA